MNNRRFTTYKIYNSVSKSFLSVTILLGSFLLLSISAQSQIGDVAQRNLSTLVAGPIPDDLLATKTIALYDASFTKKELNQIQTGFERTGIDAVIYYPIDLPFSNIDVQKVFADYLVKREIKYIVILQKKSNEFIFSFTAFNKMPTIINAGQSCWKMNGGSIDEVVMDVYRTALNSQKRINMLVSPIPEYELPIRFIKGTRGEYYAIDLKIDKLGIIKSGDVGIDTVMQRIFKEHYPFNHQFFELGTEEIDIRNKGFLFVLCSIHAPGQAAMNLLGYNTPKSGSAIASVSYPNGEMQLKTIDANVSVYKFYFKQLTNGNVYLGTKWDADTDWQQALINQIKGLKKELRIN